MNIKSKSGFTITELLVTLSIVSVVTIAVGGILSYCLTNYNASSKYISQQDKIIETVQFVSNSIEKAPKLKVDEPNKILQLTFSDGSSRYWKFAGDSLQTSTDGATYTPVVSELDTSGTDNKFKLIGKNLILSIQPQKTNSNRHQSRNINKPIITEFSVKYKEIIP